MTKTNLGFSIFEIIYGFGILNFGHCYLFVITTAKLRLLAFEQVGPFFYDATCKPLDCAVNGIQ